MTDSAEGLALFLGLAVGGAVGAITARALWPHSGNAPVLVGMVAGAVAGILFIAAVTGIWVRL